MYPQLTVSKRAIGSRKPTQYLVCGGDATGVKESTSRKAHSTSGILPTSAPSWSDTTDIQSAGVLQDQQSSAVSQSNSGTWPDTMQVFEFWEIFAGCGKLSSCLQSEGFTILPVDSNDMEHTPLVPIFFADLREPAAQHQLLERIKTTPPVGMHLAMHRVQSS